MSQYSGGQASMRFQGKDLRRFDRMAAKLAVRILIVDDHLEIVAEQAGWTVDLSQGGAAVLVAEEIPAGMKVAFFRPFTDDDQVFLAEVRHARMIDGQWWRLGLQWLAFPTQAQRKAWEGSIRPESVGAGPRPSDAVFAAAASD
ncbi:MAG: PilZ domain-containing protein [Planctomycetota bacterium]|nr:PilZ domain-containing protein [Planctomycetota bacterium]